jgi:uncharacterized membrane protein SpoIIM required for sporulation
MRTLTGYLIGVIIALALANGLAWFIAGLPKLHTMVLFSAGFLLGAIGMYIAAYVYGYQRMR